MSKYIGNQPVPQAYEYRDRFVATENQTSFATQGYSVGHVDVYLNGVHLDTTDFTATNGSDIVLTVGAASGDILDVISLKTYIAPEFADVATSGDFNDLINQPAPFDPETLATVATTGSYDDLTDLPTLGTAAATDSTAYATAAQGVTADSAVQPGDNVSDLTNDAGYATTGYVDQAEVDAISSANSYTDTRETAITTAYQSYADQAESDAISTASADATSKANTAETNAKSYADGIVASEASARSSGDSSTLSAAQSYTDTAVANLVDSSPATLDTLNELAAALGDDPNFATTVSGQIGTAQSTADTALTNANAALAKDPTLTLTGDASGSATFTNLGNATLTVTVADDSHNHTIANVDGLQSALDGKQATGDYIVASGDSMTGNLSFGDNDKAIFGAGSDLQIYHDGGNSRIVDGGAGSLILQSNQLVFKTANDAEILGYSDENGAFRLYYDGTQKLATTSTGIDVTGTATMDGLTVDGNVGIGVVPETWGSNFDAVQVGEGASVIGRSGISRPDIAGMLSNTYFDGTSYKYIGNKPSTMYLQDNGGHVWYNAASGTADATFGFSERMRIDSSGNVGIGTSSPISYRKLTLENNGSSGGLALNNSAGTLGAQFTLENVSTSTDLGIYSTGVTKMYTGGTERMRIDSSGNLLVGTSVQSGLTGPYGGTGLAANAGGKIQVSTDGEESAVFNRRTSDGDIAIFRKDGTSVGSIGVSNGDIYCGTGVTALKFNDSLDSIFPYSTVTQGNTDGTTDLGVSTARFKDLYLSGVLSDGTNSVAIADLGGGGAASSTMQVFTSSGTWTRPSGCTKIKVTVVGGGGGGGGVKTSSGSGGTGGGGGGGGCAIEFIDVTAVSSVSVTVGSGGTAGSGASYTAGGTGGTSSFGAYCSATGGAGGHGQDTYGTKESTPYGGVGTGGDLNLSGDSGHRTSVSGGSIFNGSETREGVNSASGLTGGSYGAGGSGAHAGSGTSNYNGGAGASGIVIVEEFY